MRESYDVYTQLLPKGKNKKVWLDPIEVVEVRGRKVKCIKIDINNTLDCTMQIHHKLANKLEKTLDGLRVWLASFLSENATP